MSRLQVEEDDGTLRDPTPEEVGEAIDQGLVLNEAGVPLLMRVMAKWFAANPSEAKRFFESRGFEVMEVKDKETDSLLGKMQFSIRNPALDAIIGAKNNKPTLLDPRGFDWGDLADLAFDVVVTGPIVSATTAAGAGGGTVTAPATGPAGPIAGGVLGAAAGSAGVEAVRQSIGGVLGINKEFHPEQVATAGVIGAVMPKVFQAAARFPAMLLKGTKHAAAKASLLTMNMAGKVAGVAEGDMAQAASSAARTATIRNEAASTSIELLDRMRGTIQRLRDKSSTFPETREMASILEKARRVPLKGLMDILQRKRVAGGGAPTTGVGPEKVAIRSAASRADDIAHKYGFKDANEAALGSVTAKEAAEIVDTIQSQIHWGGKAPEKFLNQTLKDAQKVLNNQIVSSLPSKAAKARFRELNGHASFTDAAGKFHQGRGVVGKMEAMNEIDKRMGEHLTKGGTAEAFLQKVTGEGRSQERRLVQQFDKLFGTTFEEEGLTTRLASKFTGDAPKITAMGGALDPAKWILPGGMAALGAKAGAPFGAPGMLAGGAVGTAAGMLAGTPKTMLKAGRIVTTAQEATNRAIKRGGQFARRVEPLADFIARTSGGSLTDPQTVIRSEEDLRK